LGSQHAPLAVSLQEKDANSTLAFARAFLKARKNLPALIDGELALLDAPDPLIAFVRGGSVLCVFNIGKEAMRWALPQPVRDIGLGAGRSKLEDGMLVLPPSSAWFGQF
jgi:alpha-glucosidase